MSNKKSPNQILFFAWLTWLIITLNYSAMELTEYRIEIKQKQIEIQKEQEKEEREKKARELEDQKKMVGVIHEAKQYKYDARKIQDKLNTQNYSNNGKKIVFLTFDDGPSTTVTPKILEVLKEENVRATFFVNGKTLENGGEDANEILKESFNYGNAIGNHSYSHDYQILYPNRHLDIDSFTDDFEKNEEVLKSVLGDYFSTRVIRCPGGYMSWKDMDKLDEYLDKNNMAEIDWNALNADSEGKKKNAQELVSEAIKSSNGKEIVVILMHDTYGKDETAKALPQIIEYFKDQGYEFKTLS